MASQDWAEILGPRHSAIGASYNTSVALTDVGPGGITNPKICPAGKLQVGSYLELDASGTYQVNATTPTLLLGFYWGLVAGALPLIASTARAVTNSATVNWPWTIHYEGEVMATGTSGSIEGHGWYEVGTSLTAVTKIQLPETAAAAVTIDTTINKFISVGAQWGTSAAGNIVFCRYFRAAVLG